MTNPDLSQYTPDSAHPAGRRARFFIAVAVLLAFVVLATAPCAGAGAISEEEELTRAGGDGSGAGGLSNSTVGAGIASDTTTGHFYTVEAGPNFRVSEFTPWGNFVKAFGWDVAPGAVNEQQEVRVRAASGQFKLSFNGSTPTPDLAFNAPGSPSEGPGSVEAALNALPSIGGVGASVSVSAVPGTPDGKTPFIYVVAFKGALAGTNVDQLTIANGATSLSGGVPSTSLEARTRADGTAGGTGLESCTAESGCKAGLEGGGPGQFADARGVAIDAAGNLYVRELTNHRVQKFDSIGHFVSMFGGEVNKTKVEAAAPQAERSICPIAPSDVCQAGATGTANGQFEAGLSGGITLCGGDIFAADKDRIQRFSFNGGFVASVPVPGKLVQALACDPVSGDLYATFEPESNVHRLDPVTGEEIGEIEFEYPRAVATDAAGNLFAVPVGSNKILEFDPTGKPLSPPSCCEASPGVVLAGLGTNAAGNLNVVNVSFGSDPNFIGIYGPPPVIFEAPPQIPPTISAQFATSVGRDDATLAADINPHFWSNARYYLQYGTGKCSEGGCGATEPVPPGALLTPKVVDTTLQSAGVILEGLEPGTTYHYRFVAQSGGGGPVRGVGGEEGVDGGESSFTTYPAPIPPKTNCPNQPFRTGFSAPLPDCRAFEMVSPVDKNNGDILALLGFGDFTTSLNQSAEDGGRFTYSSYRSFGEPKGAPFTNQYLATRDPQNGWSSEAISGAGQVSRFAGEVGFENTYKAFSSDLCSGWLMVRAEPVLAPGANGGRYLDLYRRDGCGTESYEALIQTQPASGESGFFQPVLQGVSADGKEAIFEVEDKLTDDAASGVWQAYYASKGQLHLLCIGPNGLPSGHNCSSGTSVLDSNSKEHYSERSRFASLTHAISNDGSRVYWTDVNKIGTSGGPGKVYLRLNPGEEQSAVSGDECTEAEKACTVKVSETASSKDSRFLGASPDGSKALFEITEGAQAGSLYKFDLETASSTLIAAKGRGLAGVSEDLSRVYFASEEALPGTSGAIAGKPNLYLDQEGTKTFIATLSEVDVVGDKALSNTNFRPVYHAARATPDGSRLAFISTESLTGYDNTDQATGKADWEVYLYEAGTAAPVCISCNPSWARPQGRLVHPNGALGAASLRATAASLMLPQTSLNSPRVLSTDGRTLFFDSFDALLPRDTNGKEDVYEWEAAGSAEDCAQKGAGLYVPSSEGCLSLISSGESPQDSEFLDASANGEDAFFTTSAGLLPQDPGLIDVYDARSGGGLPAPPEPPGPCQGEACQNAAPPPNDPTPASASFKGAGNPSTKGRCAKGKVARKGRCVAKKRKQAKKRHRARHANHNRGANR